ncbi:HDOD domain-containing protein [bacterium]|nr:HDOD domain-containing protein [bacterium]
MSDPIDPLVDDPDEGPEEGSSSGNGAQLLRILEQITEMAGDEPEAEVFLGEVINELVRSTGAQTAIVSLLDPGSHALDVKATVGFGTDAPDGLNYIQDGIHGWVLKIRTPMIITDQESQGGLPLLSFERSALIAAPVQVGESTYGAISVMGAPRETFHEQDMLLVSTVASLLGGMIGHRRAQDHAAESIRKAIESLTMALDARDEYTRGHSQRVAMYSLAIANELERQETHTFPKELRNSLLMAALLHDIGKIGIRDEVLLKPGRLTDEEFSLIKTHPVKGAEIVRMIPGFNDDVIAGILQHHERWDGKGYPAGTAGAKIHVFGRIIGLADTFDAIVTSRPYKTAASFSFAMTRIEELSGAAFDPEVVRGMLRAMKDQSVWADLGAISQAGVGSRRPSVDAEESDSADRTLRRIFGKNVNDLPTLPHVVSQILEKTRNADASLDEIVSLIATDQALVSTILKLVNSAFYGFSRRITTLKQAITLLGFRSVRNIVVNAGVVGVFRKRTFNNQYRFRLWDHSVACAVAARILAKPAGYKSKEEAFTAGLLHDIGKVVIDQYAPKDSAAIMKRVDAGMTACEAEMEVVGADHTQIGSMIAERWKLPRSLCWVIEHHHEPDSDRIPGNRDLVRLVAAANAFCRIRPSEDSDKVQVALEDYVASADNTLQIDLDAARALLPEIWQGKADAMKTFGGARPMEAVETADADETAAAAHAPKQPSA